MSDAVAPDASASAEIRDAACLVLADLAGVAPRLLMGRRRKDQIFLPNKWVFPGGRVDPIDHQTTLPVNDAPAWLGPFLCAAIREFGEETGVVWKSPTTAGSLTPLARAITPPGRVRRYDTWFFLAKLDGAPPTAFAGDGELLDLAWFTLTDAERLDLPSITRLVLHDAALALAAGVITPVAPFYRQGPSGFERTFIDCGAASTPP